MKEHGYCDGLEALLDWQIAEKCLQPGTDGKSFAFMDGNGDL